MNNTVEEISKEYFENARIERLNTFSFNDLKRIVMRKIYSYNHKTAYSELISKNVNGIQEFFNSTKDKMSKSLNKFFRAENNSFLDNRLLTDLNQMSALGLKIYMDILENIITKGEYTNLKNSLIEEIVEKYSVTNKNDSNPILGKKWDFINFDQDKRPLNIEDISSNLEKSFKDTTFNELVSYFSTLNSYDTQFASEYLDTINSPKDVKHIEDIKELYENVNTLYSQNKDINQEESLNDLFRLYDSHLYGLDFLNSKGYNNYLETNNINITNYFFKNIISSRYLNNQDLMDQEYKLRLFSVLLKEETGIKKLKTSIIEGAKEMRDFYKQENQDHIFVNLPEFSKAFLITCLSNIKDNYESREKNKSKEVRSKNPSKVSKIDLNASTVKKPLIEQPSIFDL